MRPASALALVALLFLATPRAAAQDITVFGDNYTLQFDEQKGEPVEDFINLAQKLLGRPIRYDQTDMQNATIRIIGPQTVRKDRFYQYFQAVLKAYDFLIVEYGPEGANFLSVQKITATGRAQGGATGQIKAQAPVVNIDDLDNFQDDPATLITTSIPLHYVNARDQMNTVQPMFDQTIEVVRAVDNANQLVITGFGSHVWGAWQLIKLIDVPPFKPTPIIHQRVLLHAAVDEIQDVVNDLLNAARGLRTGQVQQAAQAPGATIFEIEPRVIPEPRSNSLLITGDADMVARIEEWVDVLDVEVEPRGNTHVYRLKNTNAKEVEEVLTRVLDQQRLNGQQGGGGARPGGGGSAAAQGQGLEVPASAVADVASNSVIVTATERKYREIVNILREMDVRRPQVLIEAAIVETSKTLTDALTAGIASVNTGNGGLVSNFGTPTGLTDTGTVDVLGQLIPPPTGGTFALFSGGDVPIPVIVEALQTDVANRVLSRPYLMTNDNQEASISTNEQTTYATSTTTQTSTSTGFTPIEAGITLTISPSISAGNYLRLKVKIEVSNFTSPPAGVPGAPPDKTIRTVETPVTLPDGHTAILGGLVNNTATDSTSKTPWLGDIPIIGWLFRATNDQTHERYLYVFITPHIIDTDFALLDELSEGRKRDLERLGGDVRELTAELPSATDADRRQLSDELDAVFEMPSAAFPSSGERGTAPAAPATAPAAAPPSTAPATPGFDDVFGYDKSKDSKPKP
jgi:general secretion pathway protein D